MKENIQKKKKRMMQKLVTLEQEIQMPIHLMNELRRFVKEVVKREIQIDKIYDNIEKNWQKILEIGLKSGKNEADIQRVARDVYRDILKGFGLNKSQIGNFFYYKLFTSGLLQPRDNLGRFQTWGYVRVDIRHKARAELIKKNEESLTDFFHRLIEEAETREHNILK